MTQPPSRPEPPPGQVEEITLKIAAADKTTTGYQLAVTLPDKATEASLKDFYGSVLNGGAVNDQKDFDFGNETDGWYYAGSCWMYGMALAAGMPAAGQLSSRPYDAARAFREHLAHVLSVVDDKGRRPFRLQPGGRVGRRQPAHDHRHARLPAAHRRPGVRAPAPARPGADARLLHPAAQRPGAVQARQMSAPTGTTTPSRTSGVNGYYNAFFYKAACDLAEMEAAAGRRDKAREYRALAESIKTAFNRVLWKEDAPGGPRYLDWIDAEGNEVAYFCDLCQWPPIAVGIASPEQARKIVATADARIKQLEKEYGYQGFAGLSALWPVPDSRQSRSSWQTLRQLHERRQPALPDLLGDRGPRRAGDHEGAARRLRLFAQRAAEISWAGDNAADIHGRDAERRRRALPGRHGRGHRRLDPRRSGHHADLAATGSDAAPAAATGRGPRPTSSTKAGGTA